MLMSRTPFRISFFGGGTDYPSWYKHHGGSVLATTINHYCYLTCRYLPPFFEHRFHVVYSRIENCSTIERIQHPAVRTTLKYLNLHQGLEIHHDCDLPARSGLGSSSAFTVGLLHALHALHGQHPSKAQLAQESLHIEQNLLGETVGSQDQICAAYGGFNHITFGLNGEISIQPVEVDGDRLHQLNRHLMLFYTKVRRTATASEIARSYVPNLVKKQHQLGMLQALVDEGLKILVNHHDLNSFGELLHETWQLKRDLGAQISNAQIDDLYRCARAAGAVGGKLTGAGGGGFLLLFVPPERQATVRDRLHNLIYVPFQFEGSGSQIMFSDRQQPDTQTNQAIAPSQTFVHAIPDRDSKD
ncbi:MAG: kinase [Spirulina sp. SIO3F2]|nr:kinase [Spirulina sp. SIO3F2]